MRKRTAKKLVKCVDDILSSMEMLTKFKENSYMVSKVKNVYSDNMAVLENEKDAGQRYSELLDEFKKKIESSDIEGAKKTADDFKNLISGSIVYKVVFMPYKASMWDSLESVWMAADKDERCEALVVPIHIMNWTATGIPPKRSMSVKDSLNMSRLSMMKNMTWRMTGQTLFTSITLMMIPILLHVLKADITPGI